MFSIGSERLTDGKGESFRSTDYMGFAGGFYESVSDGRTDRRTDGRTDGRTQPLIEMRVRI